MKFNIKALFKPRYRYLLSLINQNRMRLFIAMVCMLAVAGATSATAFLVKPVLDDIFVKKDIVMLRLLPIGVVFIYLLRGIGLYGNAYLMNYVGETIIRHLRNRLFDHIVDLPISFFQAERTGVLMSRITNDVNIIKSMVSDAVTSSLRDVFTIVGLTFVIFYRDWKMALFAMIIVPIAFVPIVEFGKRVRRFSTGAQEAMAELNSFLHENFFGNKIVKAFGMEEREKQRFYDKTYQLFRLDMKQVVARSLSAPVMETLAGLGIAFIIWYGGSQVISGTSTPGTFFSFTAAVLMLYDPVKKLTKLNNTIQRGLAAADRVFDIIERESDIKEAPNPVVIQRKPHQVSFDNVSLAYNGTVALRGINLDVREGEIVALVGESGGGKTSLVNLIPRFYDVTEGAVRIDGLDIREASIQSLRDQIAIVTQDTILFNDTVAANIAYGRPDADFEDIQQVAEAAYALDFIHRLPQGFDTPIGELGSRLSGGQRQRLCIARALLKDAPILILDEATSALDTASEMLVQKALENLMKGRTTFVIAHRLSTISHAHRILVIVDGQIVEQGEHKALLAKGGQYAKLHRQTNKPA